MKGQVLPEIPALGSGYVMPSVDVRVSSPLCHSQQQHSLWRRNGESARPQTERPAGLLLPGEGLSSTFLGHASLLTRSFFPRCQPGLLSSGCSQTLSAAQQSAGGRGSLHVGSSPSFQDLQSER